MEIYNIKTRLFAIRVEIVDEAENGISAAIKYQLRKQILGVPARPINIKLTHSDQCSTTRLGLR